MPVEIPKNKHNIGKANGYFQRFFELLKYIQKHEDCYEYLENEYKKEFGVNRYATYNSFKRSKNYHYNIGNY